MNKWIGMGRFTRDPEIKCSANNNVVAKGTIAVDRRFKREGQANADFISVVGFGKTAEFIEKYFRKGMKAVVVGELQNNNWTDKDGNKRYDMQIVIESIEFAESKNAAKSNDSGSASNPANDAFMGMNDGFDDSDIPFA